MYCTKCSRKYDNNRRSTRDSMCWCPHCVSSIPNEKTSISPPQSPRIEYRRLPPPPQENTVDGIHVPPHLQHIAIRPDGTLDRGALKTAILNEHGLL